MLPLEISHRSPCWVGTLASLLDHRRKVSNESTEDEQNIKARYEILGIELREEDEFINVTSD